MALASSTADLLSPRIRKIAFDSVPAPAGLTMENDFSGIKFRLGGFVEEITLDRMVRHLRDDTYAELDAEVRAAVRYLQSRTAPIGVRRRGFRTKQRNILARKA